MTESRTLHQYGYFRKVMIILHTASLYRIVLCFTLPRAKRLGIGVLESTQIFNSGARKLPNVMALTGI